MAEDSEFFFSLIVNGISIGMLYALIALGFVLVYKATEALNFAQGEFVMLSGYIAAALLTAKGMPVIGAIIGTIAIMVGFSFALERVVLRPLLGRPIVAVIMATIGLAAILRGLPPLTFGAETRAVPLPIGDDPLVIGPATVPPIQAIGFVVTLIFLGGFTWFFRKSRTGVALRAVAENQQVAAAMGINVERYFALAWAMAGVASAVSGIVWGNMLGVDVQLALVGLKVFPVVILGGLDSIAGAVVGGLTVGVVESLTAGYVDPYVGGGTKDFAPYLLMIVALMFRPYGLFGKRKIERV
ncbi:MAG TPA: branched-chain amino acid ABC transporter permease [Bradyrhizobium sp.]|jgi:branched-chain amino acid transport system permease protein